MQGTIIVTFVVLLALGLASAGGSLCKIGAVFWRRWRTKDAFAKGYVCDIIVRDEKAPDIYVILLRRDTDVNCNFKAYLPSRGEYRTYPAAPEIRRGLPEIMH